MVFKPLSERTPRHLIIEDEEIKESPIPIITADGDLTNVKGTLLIIPETLKSINDALQKQSKPTKLANIIISRPQSTSIEDEEFIEEQQLYSAHIPITLTDDGQNLHAEISQYNQNLSVLVVPNYRDPIVFSLIAKFLLTLTNNDLNILTISPGVLPFDQLICQLSSQPTAYKFDKLIPPFYITGISASILSQGQILNKKVESLIVKSEGVSGFEKLNEDAVLELSHTLTEQFGFDEHFVRDVEVSLNSSKNVNNFGLYL